MSFMWILVNGDQKASVERAVLVVDSVWIFQSNRRIFTVLNKAIFKDFNKDTVKMIRMK